MQPRPYQHAGVAPALAFGPGQAADLGSQRPLKKLARVVVITDQGVTAAGVAEKVIVPLGAKVAFVDADTVPDADTAHIDAVAKRCKDASIEAIVAVGGGSVIDTAKAVAAVLGKETDILALEGFATIRKKLLPIVAVPTTSGTGAEATQFVVVKNQAAGTKVILADHSLVPSHTVLDPELIVSLPKHVTAATGVDALSHAVEALGSKMSNPVGEALALAAVRIIGPEHALENSLEHPSDLSGRGALLTAAHLAGQAISANLLGACHAFAHALGALKGVPHGVANGLFLVDTMRLNAEKVGARYAKMGRALGGTAKTDQALCDFAIEEIERLVHEVAAIPRTLTEVGVIEADLERLAELVLLDPDLASNPVRLKDAAPVLEILRGRL